MTDFRFFRFKDGFYVDTDRHINSDGYRAKRSW